MLRSAIFVAVLLQSALSASDFVQNGHFGSRSGDIVITHATPVKGDALLIAVDGMHQDLTSTKGEMPSEMQETDVAALAAHNVGASPMSAVMPPQTNAFSNSVLRKAHANLMIMVPDMGQVTSEELNLSNLQAMREENPSFTVKSTFEPRNLIAQLTTLMTGELPSVHGVLGGEWMDRRGQKSTPTSAFADFESHAAVPTVADVVLDTFPESLVVSLSGCQKLAAAGASHPNIAGNLRVVSVDTDTKTTKDQLGSSTALTEEDIIAFISDTTPTSLLKEFRRNGAVLTVTGNKVTVQPFANAGPADTTVFDLSTRADYKAFAELVAVQRLVDSLREGDLAKLAKDDSPDLFTLTLMGFHKMQKEYGLADSRTVTTARIVDSVVAQTVRLFSQVYHSRLATEVVLMGSAPVVSDLRVKKAISDVASSSLERNVNFEAAYPNLYVEESLSKAEVNTLCSRVADAASKHGVKAECVSELSQPIMLQNKAAAKADDGSYTLEDAVNYQINLWVTILLVILTYLGIYPLMYSNFTEGTFSSFLFAKKYI